MRHRQTGVALITALLVVALATVAAVSMATRQQLDVRRTANILDGDQAYSYALAVEAWGQVVLARDANKNTTDSFEDDWAQRLPPIEVPGGFVDGSIIDLQARFNLNNLIDGSGQPSPPHQDYFRNLLIALNLSPDLVEAVTDWIDPDDDTTGAGGAENNFYLSTEYPYRAANRRLESISELRLIRGFDAKTWNTLSSFVTALPVVTTLNVNTVGGGDSEEALARGAILLQALDPNFTQGQAEALLQARPKDGYVDIDSFMQDPIMAPLELVDRTILSVQSNYFLVRGQVQVGTARADTYSLVRRDAGSPAKLAVVARTQGTW